MGKSVCASHVARNIETLHRNIGALPRTSDLWPCIGWVSFHEIGKKKKPPWSRKSKTCSGAWPNRPSTCPGTVHHRDNAFKSVSGGTRHVSYRAQIEFPNYLMPWSCLTRRWKGLCLIVVEFFTSDTCGLASFCSLVFESSIAYFP